MKLDDDFFEPNQINDIQMKPGKAAQSDIQEGYFICTHAYMCIKMIVNIVDY